eukprot:2736976-Rhodomonas_salina.1
MIQQSVRIVFSLSTVYARLTSVVLVKSGYSINSGSSASMVSHWGRKGEAIAGDSTAVTHNSTVPFSVSVPWRWQRMHSAEYANGCMSQTCVHA